MGEEEWWKRLNELRQRMNGVNAALIRLLSERKEISEQIGLLKAEHGLPIYDPEREMEIIRSMREAARLHDLSEESVEEIFKLIMEMCRKVQEELIKKRKGDSYAVAKSIPVGAGEMAGVRNFGA